MELKIAFELLDIRDVGNDLEVAFGQGCPLGCERGCGRRENVAYIPIAQGLLCLLETKVKSFNRRGRRESCWKSPVKGLCHITRGKPKAPSRVNHVLDDRRR